MLARTLGVTCSRRCEALLAYALLVEPDRVHEIAAVLDSGQQQPAQKIALRLSLLPPDALRDVAEALLDQSGASVCASATEQLRQRVEQLVVHAAKQSHGVDRDA